MRKMVRFCDICKKEVDDEMHMHILASNESNTMRLSCFDLDICDDCMDKYTLKELIDVAGDKNPKEIRDAYSR